MCYADLRPAEPVAAAAPAPAAGHTAGHAAGQTGLAEPPPPLRPAPVLAPHPILDGPLGALDVPGAPATPPVRRTGKHALRPEDLTDGDRAVMGGTDVEVGTPAWPCETCGATVSLELTECPRCGAGFMASAAATVNLKVPGVGNITELSTGARVALMMGGAAVVTAVVFVLLLLLGHIF